MKKLGSFSKRKMRVPVAEVAALRGELHRELRGELRGEPREKYTSITWATVRPLLGRPLLTPTGG